MYVVVSGPNRFSCATLHSAVHTYLRIRKGNPGFGMLPGIDNEDGSRLSEADEAQADRLIDAEDYDALVPMVLR